MVLYGLCVLYGVNECFACVRVLRLMYCVMLYGLLGCAVSASVCLFVLRVIVRSVCDLLCDVAWFACFLDWLNVVRVL